MKMKKLMYIRVVVRDTADQKAIRAAAKKNFQSVVGFATEAVVDRAKETVE